MDIIIGMVLAFLLGAYVRSPFKLWSIEEEPEPHEEEPLSEAELKIKELIEEGQREDQKRQIQIANALNWNGEREKLRDE